MENRNSDEKDGRTKWAIPDSGEQDPDKILSRKASEIAKKHPTTVGEVHDKVGKKLGFTKSQTKTRMSDMAMSGKMKAHQPGKKRSKIFYNSSYGQEDE
jgi:hypothetical protein